MIEIDWLQKMSKSIFQKINKQQKSGYLFEKTMLLDLKNLFYTKKSVF